MTSVQLRLSQQRLKQILDETAPGWPLLPELDGRNGDVATLKDGQPAQALLAAAQEHVAKLYPIPQTTYTLYREFRHIGSRPGYETPYFLKRIRLTAASLALFFGQDDLLDAVQDYLWDICEESNWVVPAHEWAIIDLFAAETGFQLAETLRLLKGTLQDEVVARVKIEIEKRILQNYLLHHATHWWFKGNNNWNGVCNSSVGCTFLLLEEDTDRLAQALSLVLTGLETFLDTAFEADGGSTEGVGYWQYGLINMVCFSEMLRQRTQGQIDILSSVEKLKAIAQYPLSVMLSPGRFASFSDSEEPSSFHPGFVTRLAERTGQQDVKSILVGPGTQKGLPWGLPTALRTMLWWTGPPPKQVVLTDAHLPDAGVVRLVAETIDHTPVVVAFKAGHNGENHNQNDVGTFIIHVGGETLLCDPGCGLYSRQYFSHERYDNVFANSYGHSVPVINNQLQDAGDEFAGEILSFAPDQDLKIVTAEISGAYSVKHLESLRRVVRLTASGEDSGAITLTDTYAFDALPDTVQEAFVTWQEVSVEDKAATVHGRQYDLRLTIEAPSSAAFAVESLEKACAENEKPRVLKRLTIDLEPQLSFEVRVRMDVIPTRDT
jgi:hypothetical protein